MIAFATSLSLSQPEPMNVVDELQFSKSCISSLRIIIVSMEGLRDRRSLFRRPNASCGDVSQLNQEG